MLLRDWQEEAVTIVAQDTAPGPVIWDLIARGDALFHPGGKHSLCRLQDARKMVRSGWLIIRDGRYELTPEEHRAAEPDRT